jgi:hypothetical protein
VSVRAATICVVLGLVVIPGVVFAAVHAGAAPRTPVPGRGHWAAYPVSGVCLKVVSTRATRADCRAAVAGDSRFFAGVNPGVVNFVTEWVIQHPGGTCEVRPSGARCKDPADGASMTVGASSDDTLAMEIEPP